MKTIKYTCDNCNKETNDIEDNKWIEIGSNDNSLFINNHAKDRKLITLGSHSSIHFCSSSCLINRFFTNKNIAENE